MVGKWLRVSSGLTLPGGWPPMGWGVLHILVSVVLWWMCALSPVGSNRSLFASQERGCASIFQSCDRIMWTKSSLSWTHTIKWSAYRRLAKPLPAQIRKTWSANWNFHLRTAISKAAFEKTRFYKHWADYVASLHRMLDWRCSAIMSALRRCCYTGQISDQ